ncbi:partial Putative serine protease HhoB, partial [Planctomycetaceae bacterium]
MSPRVRTCLSLILAFIALVQFAVAGIADSGDGTMLQEGGAGGNADRLELYKTIRACTGKVIANFGDGASSVGTGVCVLGTGEGSKVKLLITNAHVVSRIDSKSREIEAAPTVKVKYWQKNGDLTLDAYILYLEWNEKTMKDLAYLIVKDPENRLSIASRWSAAEVGETVYACGNPLGEEFLIDDGQVLKPDVIGLLPHERNRLTVHDAFIERGSSGGGLFNSRGELVGVNTWLVAGKHGLAQRASWFFENHRFNTFKLSTNNAVEVTFDDKITPGQAIRAAAIGKYRCVKGGTLMNGAGVAGEAAKRRWKDHNFGAVMLEIGDEVRSFNKALMGPGGEAIIYDDVAVLDEFSATGRIHFQTNDKDILDNGEYFNVEIVYLVRGAPQSF